MDANRQLVPPADSALAAIFHRFEQNAVAVHRLMEFDRDIVEFALSKLRAVHNEIQRSDRTLGKIETLAENAVTALTNIRHNQSLRREYRNIHNQGVVLLVSYFSSAVKDLFIRCVNERLRRLPDDQLPGEPFKLSLAELRNLAKQDLGEMVVDKEELSFQDMKSIARGFKTWVQYEPDRDDDVRNIIAAQACRHAIVHAGGVADARLIQLLRNQTPRTVKPDLAVGDEIGFSLQELKQVSESMTKYLLRTANGSWLKLPKDHNPPIG